MTFFLHNSNTDNTKSNIWKYIFFNFLIYFVKKFHSKHIILSCMYHLLQIVNYEMLANTSLLQWWISDMFWTQSKKIFSKNRFVFGTDLRNLYSLTKFDLGFVAYITVRAVTYISMFFLSHFVHTVQEQLYIER